MTILRKNYAIMKRARYLLVKLEARNFAPFSHHFQDMTVLSFYNVLSVGFFVTLNPAVQSPIGRKA